MKTPAAWKTCLFAVVLATGCGEREAAAPPAGADAGEVAPPESVDMGPLPATASTAPAAPAAPAEPAYAISSDPDRPAPLPALEFKGAGAGRSESRYFAFDAGVGTVVVTATASNAPSGATQALGFALYDRQANRLCFDSHGNTTSPKTVVLNCTIEKAQPLLLRLDLSPESLDHAIALSGPVTLPAPVADAGPDEVAGAGSTDIDAPTRLATNRVAAEGTGKPVSYYYAFNAGPGELTLTGVGSNAPAAVTEALRLGLYTLRSERICELTLGNTTLDKRAVTTCTLD
jgi:hypothetical protein